MMISLIFNRLSISLTSLSWINDLVGLFFLVALVLINIPQFLKIYRLKSSHGFSIWFMFLGYSAAFLSWINSLTFYINSWWKCHGSRECAEGFIGLGIILIQWVLYLISYLLFLYYLSQPAVKLYYSRISRRCLAISTFCTAQVIGVLSLTITLVLLAKHNFQPSDPPSVDLTSWASTQEIIILIFFLIHYLPQLYETYRIKRAGSISLISLGIMCPGSYLWTIFLAVQGYVLKNNQAGNPMVWIPYLAISVMQTVLLVMGIYYEHRANKRIRGEEARPSDPLVINSAAVNAIIQSDRPRVVIWD